MSSRILLKNAWLAVWMYVASVVVHWWFLGTPNSRIIGRLTAIVTIGIVCYMYWLLKQRNQPRVFYPAGSSKVGTITTAMFFLSLVLHLALYQSPYWFRASGWFTFGLTTQAIATMFLIIYCMVAPAIRQSENRA